MACGEAEDAGGLTPVKDDNEAARHFIRRTLLILDCVDYNIKCANPRTKRTLPDFCLEASFPVQDSAWNAGGSMVVPLQFPQKQDQVWELDSARPFTISPRT